MNYRKCYQSQVPANLIGFRLDKAMAKMFPNFSRSCLQKWIKSNIVYINGNNAKASQRVSYRSIIKFAPDLTEKQKSNMPENIVFSIIYEDNYIIIINKPAGIVVHPAPGNWTGTIFNGLLYRYQNMPTNLYRAGIIHRLDKNTSGLMIVAKNIESQINLINQLKNRIIKRNYFAVVYGDAPEHGVINTRIGRDIHNRTRMTVMKNGLGKNAITFFKKIDIISWKNNIISIILCRLETGRTHQIRVHCNYIGHPIVGDSIYRKNNKNIPYNELPNNFCRQALHASSISLIHPKTGNIMNFCSEIPIDMKELIKSFKFKENI